jgi:hypothetical protein
LAVFGIGIEKYRTDNELFRWTNQYHVTAPSLQDAEEFVTPIINFERAIHTPRVTLAFARTSDLVPDTDNFVNRPINLPGLENSEGDPLPLFLAVRVDLTPTVGRSGRKFYHTFTHEGQQSTGVWGIGYRTFIQEQLDALYTAVGVATLCNETGTRVYIAGTVFGPVTQHQFRRGSKRRVPILG